MCKLRDVVIFVAGAEFFHTLSHIILPYIMEMPFKLSFMEWTQTANTWAIAANGIVTILLLLWAWKLSK